MKKREREENYDVWGASRVRVYNLRGFINTFLGSVHLFFLVFSKFQSLIINYKHVLNYKVWFQFINTYISANVHFKRILF
jgi:hypothetical protein